MKKNLKQIDSKKIKKLFIDLISIDSPSGEEKKVRLFIEKELKKLNLKTSVDSFGNLWSKIPGKGEPILLSAHMDTVEPGRGIRPIVKGDLITSDGRTILGTDNKAGITEILVSLEYLIKNKLSHRPIELIFTREEEIGSLGVKNLDFNKIKSKEALVLDRSGEPQTVVIASPFFAKMKIEILGKSAHAASPEMGINAIKIAADAISKIQLGRIDKETTVNIGLISGGDASNVIPSKVEVFAECRSHNFNKLKTQTKLIEKSFIDACKKPGGKINFFHHLAHVGYSHSKKDKLINKILKAWQQMNITPIKEITAAASDANDFNEHGIKAVNIGYAGRMPHSCSENIKISEMKLVCEFLINFLTSK
ncbi:MAG: Peptidase T-like protein [Parcubacteria group bacterium GW2011_GWE2_38_18]|nr:MAG: Peptidase T-like protein [Parcubacteria group bacterium GW2011_GWE2_38_18]